MDNLAADFIINPNNPLNAEYELNKGVGFDCSFELFAAGTVWGSIDGDINNQTDLINILNNKVNLSDFETLNDTVIDNYTDLNGKITTTNNNLSSLSQTVEDNNTAINNRVDGIVDSFDGDISDLNDAISDLSDTVTNNYNTLDGRITTNSNNISSLQNTINSYGDIVTYDAAYFATANQGTLADTALQPNDNISELVNDVGYITSASLPTDYVPNTRTINGYALSSNITLNYSDVGALSASTTINDLTTTAQQNALNSGATTTNIGQITINQNNISDIQDLIPNQATTSNQLADKDFVNSSIATNTAYFIGTFNSVAELEAYSGTLTNNDYAFVVTTDSAGNTLYDRYKYNGSQWLFEYELNNSSFTAAQWSAINSGATNANIGQIATNTSDIADLQTNKQDNLTAGANIQINNNVISATDTTYTAGTGISIVNNVISNTQTSAEWGNITGTLSNQTDLQNALNTKYDASNPDEFITSADLPTNYVTTDTVQDISGRKTFLGEKAIYFKQQATANKLGFTLYNPSNGELGAFEFRPGTISGGALLNVNVPSASSNYVGFRYWGAPETNIVAPKAGGNYYIPVNVTDGTSTVTASSNGTLDISSLIPTVNDGTITINQGGTLKGTFTVNQNGNTTIDLDAGSTITVDQTYDSTSANAQSGVAIAGAGFLQNVATGTDGLTIEGISSSESNSINIGKNSRIKTDGEYAIAIGNNALGGYGDVIIGNGAGNITSYTSSGGYNTAIGYNANSKYESVAIGGFSTSTGGDSVAIGANARADGYRAIQIGAGTNDRHETLQIFSYQLLDSAGIIPDARISNNVARTTDIPTVNNGTLTIQKNGTDVTTFTANASSNVTANITVPTAISDLTDDTATTPIDKADSLVDQNTGLVKMWTGTKAQYDAIVTKDADTIYNVEDTGNTPVYTKDEVDALLQAQQEAFQDELYYKAGDNFGWSGVNNDFTISGIITGSTEALNFTIPVIKNLTNITTITCSNLVLHIRKPDGGYLPSSSWNATSYATFSKLNDYYISVTISYSFGGTNNIPVGVSISSISLTFS